MEGGNASCTVYSRNGKVPVQVKSIVKEDNGYRFIFETVRIRVNNSMMR